MSSVLPLKLYNMVVTNQDLQNDITQLELQMQTDQGPQKTYDALRLQQEKIELQVREANPNLDPTTQAGIDGLQDLLAQNTEYTNLQDQISQLLWVNRHNNPQEWGIPINMSGAIPVDNN